MTNDHSNHTKSTDVRDAAVRRSAPQLGIVEGNGSTTAGTNDSKDPASSSSIKDRKEGKKRKGRGQVAFDDMPAEVSLPYAARPSIRISFCLTSLVLAVVSSVLMWLAVRTPGESALLDQALAQAHWRIDHVESSIGHLLYGMRQAALEHLAWYTQASPSNPFGNAHTDLLSRVVSLDAIASMSAVAGSQVVGYYATQRQGRDRTGLAMYRVASQIRNEWNLDASGNPATVIIGSLSYVLQQQPWWQSTMDQLKTRSGQPGAEVTWQSSLAGNMTTTFAWTTMQVTSTNDWLVLAAQSPIAPPDVSDGSNVTVLVATDYAMLSAALSKGLGTIAGEDTFGSLDYEAFIVDAGSLDVIAASSPMTLRLASLRFPLAQVATTAGVDPALKAFAAKAVAAPDTVPLVHDASWTISVSSDSYTATSSMSGLAYRYFVRNVFKPSSSTSAVQPTTFATPGSHGWPANWYLVVAVPASSIDDVVPSVRGSLFVLFSIIWGVISAVSLCVVLPTARSLSKLARGALMLAAGSNPDVDMVLTPHGGDAGKRVPREAVDLEGAVALLVGQVSFREFFFKWRKAKGNGKKGGAAPGGGA
ncbi:hypothetical protein BCR44DRAFT_71147 [Catenaria anguillulae PL171]|uniref:Uncharacterized protein n=1 Tax=Catenaria anguillulae PL171 TaxID=765915 RepID=A0A1Y2HSL7_9FUNG|nr:hypothetical protein BCR44DRAFT_71147 [Catenaria anguillulae PL171]